MNKIDKKIRESLYDLKMTGQDFLETDYKDFKLSDLLSHANLDVLEKLFHEKINAILNEAIDLTGDYLSVDTPEKYREVSEYHIALNKLKKKYEQNIPTTIK